MMMINIFPWPRLPRRGLDWLEYYQLQRVSGLFGTTKALRNRDLEKVHCFCPSFGSQIPIEPTPPESPEVKWQYTHRSSGTRWQIFTTQHASFFLPLPFLCRPKPGIDSSRRFNLLTWSITTIPCFFLST